MNIKSNLTIFFEDPFWVGIFERTFENKYEVTRIVFGPEPKDYEVYAFINSNHSNLKFSEALACENLSVKKVNPKRLQRKIKQQLQSTGTGTLAQQAMKLQYENNKLTRKRKCKEATEQEQERKFNLRAQKRKEKHKGH